MKRCLHIAVVLGVLSLSTLRTVTAQAANTTVFITFTKPAHEVLAKRVASELRSDGYDVHWADAEELLPCEADATSSVNTVPAAWVRLGGETDVSASHQVLAEVCYRSTGGTLLRGSTAGALSEPQRVALATVEVLNALAAEIAPPPSSTKGESPLRRPAPASPTVSAFVGAAVAAEPNEVPAMFGASGGVQVKLAGAASLLFDSFWSLTPAELTAPGVNAVTRTAWFRVGPRLDWRTGPWGFAGSVSAGPALVWVNAEAEPPEIGITAVSTNAIVAARLGAEYTVAAPLFIYASGGVAELFPRVRLDLDAATSRTLGRLLLETSVGVGLRWSPL